MLQTESATQKMETEVQHFYKDKSIFLTGGSGFLGKAFVEKILRATQAKCIYILMRSKKGKNIKERVENMLKDPLFQKVPKDALERVTPINGDCILPNLGLSEQDRATLIQNVNIVMHSAATVRFTEPLNEAVNINVRATMDLIRLAKEMPHLKAFVHVSSAFANCNASHIDEVYYADKIGVTADGMCRMADIMGPNIINYLSNELSKDYPNTYCFTKALAEEAVLTQGNELPICIFRPGIVVSTCQEPLEGWADNINGPTSILYGASYGILHVMYVRPESNANIVPVDFCANMMAVCAWQTAKSVRQIEHSPPPIYNLVPDKTNMVNWAMYMGTVEQHGYNIPLSRCLWYPFVMNTSSKFLFKLLCFIYHTVPGYIFDFVLMLRGKRRRMVDTYRKIHRQLELFYYFAENDWTFSMDNTQQLWRSLTPEDQQLFPFDMLAVRWLEYFYKSIHGMRLFLAKEEPSTIPKAKQLLNRLLILHRAVQLLVYGGGAMLLYWIFKKKVMLSVT